MPKVALYKMDGNVSGEIELNDEVFGAEINEALMHQVVKMQLANKRQGTQSALTRSEVRGGGAKPWRQKGTGRARHGSIRSPIWVKGGVAFAPKPRDYSYKVPKKMRRLAIKSALSSKVAEDNLIVLDAIELSEPKTREIAKMLENLNIDKKAALVLNGKNEWVERAARNIPNLKLLYVNTLNVYDILKYEKFIILEEAVRQIEEVYA
ncbi:MAG TPA: 50S ribosomal protein L4 [Clostridiales bacterium]|nr:50S ribosomal protein L4 [Clostridiales bacterium]